MAKGKARRKPAPRGGQGGGSADMMQQVQQLQQEMAKTQEKLGSETVEVAVGGGAVTLVITGHQRVESVTINPDLLDPEDVEMLQDLIIAAVNEGVERSQTMAAEKLDALTGGLQIPGLF